MTTSQGESVRGRSPLTIPLTITLTSPFTLYDDVLHGIYAFLTLAELIRAAVTCKHWMNAAVKKQAGRPLSCLCLSLDIIQSVGFQHSPFVKHMAPLRVFSNSTRIMTYDLEHIYGTRMSALVCFRMNRVKPDAVLATILADITHIDRNFGQWIGAYALEYVLQFLNPTTAGLSEHMVQINFSQTVMTTSLIEVLVRRCPHLTSLEPTYFALDALPLLDQLPHLTRLRVAIVPELGAVTVDAMRVKWNRMDFSRLTHLTLVGTAEWLQLWLDRDQHLRFPQLQSLTVTRCGLKEMPTVYMSIREEKNRAILFANVLKKLITMASFSW